MHGAIPIPFLSSVTILKACAIAIRIIIIIKVKKLVNREAIVVSAVRATLNVDYFLAIKLCIILEMLFLIWWHYV